MVDWPVGTPTHRYNNGMYGTSIYEMSANAVDDPSVDFSPWWQIDYGADRKISSVAVTNRGDGTFGDRLNGFYIAVDGVKCAENVQIGSGATVDVPCAAQGQVLRIGLPDKDATLTLCEVAVASEIIQDPSYKGSCSLGHDGSYDLVSAADYISAPCEPTKEAYTPVDTEVRTCARACVGNLA